jgi:hypothetical protein
MGIIRRLADSKKYVLGPFTMVGRNSTCDLQLSGQHVSVLHAVLEWSPDATWHVRDLGSRNGTQVRGTTAWPATSEAVALGDVITFGAEHESWILEDTSRPEAEVRDPLTGDRLLAQQGMLTFPSEPGELVEIVEEAPDRWVLERNGLVEDLRDEQLVVVEGRTWRLRLPLPIKRTEPLAKDLELRLGPLGGTSLHFEVSRDLEHVTMIVNFRGRTWHTENAYVRGLVELAKARIEDQANPSLPEEEHGWVYGDDLCTMAGYESIERLNVEIHRARRDMAKHGVPDAMAVVSRRRGTRQLRIGTGKLTVVQHG